VWFIESEAGVDQVDDHLLCTGGNDRLGGRSEHGAASARIDSRPCRRRNTLDDHGESGLGYDRNDRNDQNDREDPNDRDDPDDRDDDVAAIAG
jgi:hypothetical protein